MRAEIGACGAGELCALAFDAGFNARLFWADEERIVLVLEPGVDLDDTVPELRVGSGFQIQEPLARMLGRTAITLAPGDYPIHRTPQIPAGFVEMDATGEVADLGVPEVTTGQAARVSPELFRAIDEWSDPGVKDITLLDHVQEKHPEVYEEAVHLEEEMEKKHHDGFTPVSKSKCQCMVIYGHHMSPATLETDTSWSAPYDKAQRVKKYGWREDGKGALQAQYSTAYVKRETASTETSSTGGGPDFAANYSGLQVMNLCWDEGKYKTDCGCEMSLEYIAEHHSKLYLYNRISDPGPKSAGEVVAHSAAALNVYGLNPTTQTLFDKQLGATLATNLTADYSGLGSLIGSLAGIGFTLATGEVVTGPEIAGWASDITLAVLNGLIVRTGTGDTKATDKLSAKHEGTVPLPPNQKREVIVFSRGRTASEVEAGLGKNSQSRSARSASMLLVARVSQEKSCPYDPKRKKSLLLYHAGAIEAVHPNQSWETVQPQPPISGATIAHNFQLFANFGIESQTPGWQEQVLAHKNLILNSANHGGWYDAIPEP